MVDEHDRQETRAALARRLRDLRESRRLPVDFWAYKLGVTRATVLRWERELAVPTMKQLDRIAVLLWLELEAPAELRALVNRSNGLDLSEDRDSAGRAIEQYRADQAAGFPPNIGSVDLPISLAEELYGWNESGKRPPAPASIFVSYRREGSAAYVRHIVECLQSRYGRSDVFFDLRILRGRNFVKEIIKALNECNVVVVVIGPDWEGSRAGARPRIFEQEDYVAIEVAAALARWPAEVQIIPALVGDRAMPRPDALPEQLAELAHINALTLADVASETACTELVGVVAAVIPDEDD